MDDSDVCHRIGSDHCPAHRRPVLRHQKHYASDASRFLWHSFLAWLHITLDRRGDLDQLHETGRGKAWRMTMFGYPIVRDGEEFVVHFSGADWLTAWHSPA